MVPQVWSTLLQAFESGLLHVARSKFTQFLLFYAAQKDARGASTALIELLLQRLMDARQATITRSACAAYLASFLARAAFVPEQLTVTTVERLAAWAASYCGAAAETAAAGPAAVAAHSKLLCNQFDDPRDSGAARHQVFYGAVQALLYVLCYHLRPLLASRTNSMTASGKPCAVALSTRVAVLVRDTMPKILGSRLAPFRLCARSVVAEFSRQAAQLHLLDCSGLPGADVAEEGSAAAREHRPLEMFFPFDPYLLHRSARFLNLQTSYMRWAHGHPAGSTPGSRQQARGAGPSDASSDDIGVPDHDSMAGLDTDDEAVDSASSSSSTGSDSDDDSDAEGRGTQGCSLDNPDLFGLPPLHRSALHGGAGAFGGHPLIKPLGHGPGQPIGRGYGVPMAVANGGGAGVDGGSPHPVEQLSPSPSPHGNSLPMMLACSLGPGGMVPMSTTPHV